MQAGRKHGRGMCGLGVVLKLAHMSDVCSLTMPAFVAETGG